MANHLRELLDQAMVQGIGHNAEYTNTDQENAEIALASLKDAICFDCGEYERYLGTSSRYWPVELPYVSCWFETAMSSGVIIGISARVHDGGDIVCSVFIRHGLPKIWSYQFAFQCRSLVDEKLYSTGIDVNKDRISLIKDVREFLVVFLQALNCKNIVKKENKPDEKLQKARAKRGKKPLFSYWTLELTDSKSEQGQSLGGSHVSPRLHLRRGHPRQFKPGEWTWVQPCVVGNKKLGMVHKDYKFVPGEMAA